MERLKWKMLVVSVVSLVSVFLKQYTDHELTNELADAMVEVALWGLTLAGLFSSPKVDVASKDKEGGSNG